MKPNRFYWDFPLESQCTFPPNIIRLVWLWHFVVWKGVGEPCSLPKSRAWFSCVVGDYLWQYMCAHSQLYVLFSIICLNSRDVYHLILWLLVWRAPCDWLWCHRFPNLSCYVTECSDIVPERQRPKLQQQQNKTYIVLNGKCHWNLPPPLHRTAWYLLLATTLRVNGVGSVLELIGGSGTGWRQSHRRRINKR